MARSDPAEASMGAWHFCQSLVNVGRQLYLMATGERTGSWAVLMIKGVVEKLTNDDIVAIFAHIARSNRSAVDCERGTHCWFDAVCARAARIIRSIWGGFEAKPFEVVALDGSTSAPSSRICQAAR